MKNGKMPSQSRKWLMTINNPEEHGFTHDAIKDVLGKIENITYWCMCDEIGGKTKGYHTHVFLVRKSPIKFDYMKKLFPPAHFDYPLGTSQQNHDYIRKEGAYLNSEKALTNLKDTYEEFGELPDEQQGKRNDLKTLYGYVKDGLTNYEILEINPSFMNKLEKIDYTREIVRSEIFKETFRELTVEYRFGKTGQGKSRDIMERYGYANVYRVTDYRNPFDGYAGQDVIVFEEFYSYNVDITQLLNYLDGYPLQLPCRYRNKTACYTKVFINSNIPLERQYEQIQREYRETWLALLRRINCIKEFSDHGLIGYENTGDYINRWKKINYSDTPFYKKSDDKRDVSDNEQNKQLELNL